jgi:hypothetical protein
MVSGKDDHEDTPAGFAAGGEVLRRTFLKLAGAVGVVATTDPSFGRSVNAAGVVEQVGPVPDDDFDIGLVPTFVGGRTFDVTLRRRVDMVRLRAEGYNLRIDRSTPGGPRLRLVNPAANGAVVITFPPQAVLEEAAPSPAVNPTPGTIGTRLSGPSRLSFIVPSASIGDGIAFTTEGLLDWADWLLNTSPVARAAAGDAAFALAPLLRPAAPSDRETSIEAPWWLQISPNRRGGFVASTSPVVGAGSGHTELWHARFATRPGLGGVMGPLTEEPSPNRTIRAIWSPDPELSTWLPDPVSANDGPVPFASTLTQSDRVSLVRLTSDALLPGSTTNRTAVPVDTLTLSSLGATLDLGQSFADALDISLKQWRHRSTFGRDHYVRVVKRGYLLPFGHRASRVIVSERKFVGNGSSRAGVLERREFLVVDQPFVDHEAASTMPTGGRQVPFRSVRIQDRVTPDVNPSPLPGSGVQVSQCFFPVVNDGSNADLVFHAIAVDRDGRSVDVLMPMAFVDGAIADDPVKMATVRAAWNAYVHPTRRWARLSGQRVAYAPSLGDRPGATSVITDRIHFDVTPLADESLPEVPGRPRFWAAMNTAEVRLEEIESVSANTLGATTLAYDPVYRSDGFESPTNAGGMWALIGGAAGIPLRFSRPANAADQPGVGSDRAGGVITPDLQIRGLSRSLGVAAGDPQALRAGTFDPASFFAGPSSQSPKLLGGISLLSVIAPAAIPAGGLAPPAAMAITTRRTNDAIESAIIWTPDLVADPAGIFSPGSFRLDALVRTPLDGSDTSPSSRVDGELANFSLNIPTGDTALIRIRIDRLRFASRDGRKPEIDVDVGGVSFGGELEYIATLSKYLNFGDGGVDIDVLPDRIAVGLAIQLPNLTFGVFALRNIRFAAGLDVPLSGDPIRVRFELSSRDDPFRLTVFCIGGGGYLGLAFGPDGLETLELGLEAGAEIALDLGVASGSISAMFGAVLLVSQQGGVDTAEFFAYFRLNGSVSAGPVSASITLTLQLGYQERTKNGKTVRTLYGRGTIEIDLSVPLLPTPPISVTIERSFKSDAADPAFADQLSASDWDAYCNAYGAA